MTMPLARLILVLGAAFALTGCGADGPPIPPTRAASVAPALAAPPAGAVQSPDAGLN
jgi:hypothetical protein